MSRFRGAVAVLTASAVVVAPAEAAHRPSSVYVTNVSSDSVSQYEVRPGGTLAPLDPPTVPASVGPDGVAVSPDGKSVYVANEGTPFGVPGKVGQYDVGRDGSLTPKSIPEVAAGDASREVAISPDGANVYVANAGSDTVSQYRVRGGGRLIALDPPTVATGSAPLGIAVSPDGSSVYVCSQLGDTVSQYDITRHGGLSPKDPPTVATGATPVNIALAADGASAYVTNLADGTVSQYSIDPAGRLGAKSPPSVDAGATPEAIVASPDGRGV
jgi:DNA-binding beta-propeller fold protein YncE